MSTVEGGVLVEPQAATSMAAARPARTILAVDLTERIDSLLKY
jgi:hypothetical protein